MSEKSVLTGTVYGVWADQSTLRRESLGPLFGRVSLELRGAMDDVWESCYIAVRHDVINAGGGEMMSMIPQLMRMANMGGGHHGRAGGAARGGAPARWWRSPAPVPRSISAARRESRRRPAL